MVRICEAIPFYLVFPSLNYILLEAEDNQLIIYNLLNQYTIYYNNQYVFFIMH